VIEPVQAELSVDISNVDLIESVEVDVLREGAHKRVPSVRRNVVRQQPALLRDLQVAAMSHQPGIRQQQSARALMEPLVLTEMLGTEIVAEQEMRQRLDEDLGRRGHEVQVYLFRDDDLSTEHVLAMQRSSRDGSSSPPQQVVGIVQAAQIQLVPRNP
jgi:hypothetical protein